MEKAYAMQVKPVQAPWVIILHTSDGMDKQTPFKGRSQLNELVADYFMIYADGSEASVKVRERNEIGAFSRLWGENGPQCVTHYKHYPIRPHHEQPLTGSWGFSQLRNVDSGTASVKEGWVNWV